MNCNEPSCLSKLFNSAKAKCFSMNEMIANLYCELKQIALAIRNFNESYLEREAEGQKYSWSYEVWSFNEAISVDNRPICRLPVTGNLTEIIFDFQESPDNPGVSPISFNLIIDGTVIASYVASAKRYDVTLDLVVYKGKDMEIQITNYPDLPYEDNWNGLMVHTFITKAA